MVLLNLSRFSEGAVQTFQSPPLEDTATIPSWRGMREYELYDNLLKDYGDGAQLIVMLRSLFQVYEAARSLPIGKPIYQLLSRN